MLGIITEIFDIYITYVNNREREEQYNNNNNNKKIILKKIVVIKSIVIHIRARELSS
jgi:hypothetical protein